MRSLLNLIITIVITFISYSHCTFAQQDSIFVEKVLIELKDGSNIIGDIVEEDEHTIIIKTITKLEIKIPKEEIVNREIIQGQIHEEEFWKDDPNQTRIFFAPTGKGLKKGDAYFSIYELFFPFLAVGITDWITIAGGISLVPGADEQLFYISPKITPLQVRDFDFSVGALFVSLTKESETNNLAYGVATYGTEKASVTFGIGFGISGRDFGEEPVIVLGGEIRISRTIKFLSENWFITSEEESLHSFGLRFFGESLAADFGLIFSLESGNGFPFLPWVGFAYNF